MSKSKNNIVLSFEHLSSKNVGIAGGKGASLGELTQAGISVPPGFVILSTAFEKFLEQTDLNVEIDSILDSVNHKEIHTFENAAAKIQALIHQAEMPKGVAEEIKKFFKNLHSEYVAVRSSATAEDSVSAAWAGQLETYLNTTEKHLLENVKNVGLRYSRRAPFFIGLRRIYTNRKYPSRLLFKKWLRVRNQALPFLFIRLPKIKIRLLSKQD